ncbi:EVE domain-containing protein [Methanoplanus endosymbiosus]|uniref:EVE domain-containing protein n=1 Tax=Methanoplanus endosymbiosus TaxID=33865 RepID=A0A9E7PQ75_9EURY|nr:EVE domain-containing protein [Methanoplanus endosymbiosus]UUX92981.1 EVE domain-containing protein [Methanoplanus endosymbiosus]
MTVWIASTNRENWEVIEKKNLWGVPKRNKNSIGRSNPGDKILIFVRQEKTDVKDEIIPSAITGAFEIVSEPFEDESPVFKKPPTMPGEEFFPYRVKLKPVEIFDEPLDFKSLIPELEFITNKKQWTGHLRTAMRTIPDADYEYIMKAAKTPRG